MKDISDGTENTAPIDVSDSRDFMAQALARVKEAAASGVTVKVDVPLGSNVSAAVKAQKERAAKVAAMKDAIAAEKGLAIRPSSASSARPSSAAPTTPKPALSAEEQEEADETAAEVASASKNATDAGKAAAKTGMEQAATKATSGAAALQALLKEAAISNEIPIMEPDKQHVVALKWTDEKLAQGVSLNASRDTASSTKRGAQLCDKWIAGGKRGLIWTVGVALDSVTEDTTIGIVGRNFYPSSWEEELSASRHAIVVRCGDGSVKYKGRATSFRLRALKSGDKLTLTLDMQTQAMTVELMGKEPGSVVSSLELEGLPAELTMAVGFGAGGAGVPQQSVRVVGCTCEKPGMELNGKRIKDLWDDENVQLLADELKEKGESVEEQQAKVASAMGGD